VHIKVDTGMGRIGMTPATAAEAIPDIAALPALRLEGVYTHLAQAENASRVREQLGLFDRLIHSLRGQGLSFLVHAANSEALLLRPESRYDMARPGLALYGVPPAPGVRGLVPVLTWKTRVVFLKDVSKGTRVSYGGTWRASRRSRLATLPVGYADGYRRALSTRGEVLVRGRRCPVVGRVTMDQIIVDVTDARGADIGEEVVLLGRQGRASVTAEDMAAWADTIPYEILCGLTARVQRVYS
jgi:alanine racemase